MRVLMKITLPVETSNARIKDGSLPKIVQSILEEQKPEAAYFYAVDGRRGGIVVVDMTDPSELPKFAEPWFLAFNATIEGHVAMRPEDLAKAAPAIEQAVKKYA